MLSILFSSCFAFYNIKQVNLNYNAALDVFTINWKTTRQELKYESNLNRHFVLLSKTRPFPFEKDDYIFTNYNSQNLNKITMANSQKATWKEPALLMALCANTLVFSSTCHIISALELPEMYFPKQFSSSQKFLLAPAALPLVCLRSIKGVSLPLQRSKVSLKHIKGNRRYHPSTLTSHICISIQPFRIAKNTKWSNLTANISNHFSPFLSSPNIKTTPPKYPRFNMHPITIYRVKHTLLADDRNQICTISNTHSIESPMKSYLNNNISICIIIIFHI